jgi:hypothetical protein
MSKAAVSPAPLSGWLARFSLPLVLMAVLLDAGAWWVAVRWVSPDADPWECALFRPAGDNTYLPLIRAVAEGNFGNPVDYLERGKGPMIFPYLSLVPFAVLLKLFGPAGFLLADLGMQLGRWWLLYRILRELRVEKAAARWWAAAISLVSALILLSYVASWSHTWLGVDRIPRPLVTDLVMLGLFWSLLRALLSPPGRFPLRAVLVASALVGLVPHGDYHGIFSLVPLVALTCLYLWWRERQGGWRTFGKLALGSLPALGLALLWVAQVTRVPAEISHRLGVFGRSRWDWPLPTEFFRVDILAFWAVSALLLAGGAWLVRERLRAPGGRELRLLVIGVGGVLLLVLLAPWISLVLTGRLIQVYQFGQRLGFMACYAVSLALVALTYAAWAGRVRASRDYALRLGVPAAAVALWLPAILWAGLHAARESFFNRVSFRELAYTLRSPEFANLQVLATNDPTAYSWWVTSLDRGVYLGDSFASNLPDREIEDRLLRFGVLCRAKDIRFVVNPLVLFYFHSHAKYQFGPSRRFAPDLPLTAEEAEKMRGIHFSDCWNLVPPLPEVRRMEKRFMELAAEPLSADSYPFDLVVLTRNLDEFMGEPDPRLFRKVLTNSHYHVYVKNTAVNGSTSPAFP